MFKYAFGFYTGLRCYGFMGVGNVGFRAHTVRFYAARLERF